MVVKCSRAVLVRGGDEPEDVTPVGFNVRTTVQEYGGGAFTLVNHSDEVVFSNFDDQRLYKQAVVGGTYGYGSPSFCKLSVSLQIYGCVPSWRVLSVPMMRLVDAELQDG